ncbi:MAG TPA: adenylate/guanylate cyclase domain-containing protein [Stellaceae bacterium]|nr:adenylate/guanylate cyclase domain-containing protein [Stellaceae bacterium]
MRLPAILKSGSVYLLPLAVLVLAVGARLAAPDLLDRLSLISFDLYQRAAPRQAQNLPIRIVDIDDRSLKTIGQWPWPRTVIAKLVDRLREAGAAVIGFDIDFAEKDRTAPEMLLPLVTQSGVSPEEARKILSDLPEPDTVLAAAMRKVPVVTGFILSDHGSRRPPLEKAGFAFAGNDPLGHVDAFPSAIANRPDLEAAAAGDGFLNQHLDWDHVVRRVPLILKLGNTPYPSLAAELLRVVSGAKSYIGKAAGANGERNFGENTGLTAIRIGPLTVPTDAAGRVWLHFARPPTNLYISAQDILSGHFDRKLIADNIVLVGTSAEGVINDMQATPLAPNVPGVAIHAQLIAQILEGDYLARPDWALGAEVLFTFLIGIGLIFALPRIGALPSAILGAAAVAAAVGTSWLAFKHADLLLDPVYPTVVLTLVYLVASLLGYLRTEIRQREIRGAFSRYMSPHYVEVLARHPEKLVLGGETRQLTIMFCDIRGFTTLSEGLDAHSLTMLMNSFTSPMTDIITEYRGTIDKYIGDCIMAFWNAPLDDPEHPLNAVHAAQAMRRKLAELNHDWEAEARAAGKPFKPLRFGIGINTGECVVGNFGSTQRFNYSLLGDPVNLASRLESLGKLYGIDLVIGEETANRLGEEGLVEIDRVAVKGKTQAVCVYTIPLETLPEDEFRRQHAALLAAYRGQQWDAALALLDSGRLALSQHLAPVYELYRRRIAHFRIEAPPIGWNGVYTAEEK